jgi:hypothetical protein
MSYLTIGLIWITHVFFFNNIHFLLYFIKCHIDQKGQFNQLNQ